MSRIPNMLNDLENILLNENVEIQKALKLGYIIANHYNDPIAEWINDELHGYSTSKYDERDKFPNYRKLISFLEEKYVDVKPAGFGQIAQIHGANYSSLEDSFLFQGSIQAAIDHSKKKKVYMTYMSKTSGENFSIVIEPSEFKNLINAVNMKLLEYVNEKQNSLQNFEEETIILNLLNKFHKIAKQLEIRHDNRSTLKIQNEYDVQDLLYALLWEHFDSIHPEEYGPSYAGIRPRIDFFLQYEALAIEVKCIRDRIHAKKIHKEIIQDKEYYSKKPNIKILYFFIYDPNSFLLNREDFIKDLLENIPKNFEEIKIIIKPDI